MYMGCAAGNKEECAVLIFAHNSREARNFAWKELYYMINCELIETRVNRLWKDAPHLLAVANQKKYDNDKAHVIDNPGSCEGCGYWGEDIIIVDEFTQICTMCEEEAEEERRYNY